MVWLHVLLVHISYKYSLFAFISQAPVFTSRLQLCQQATSALFCNNMPKVNVMLTDSCLSKSRNCDSELARLMACQQQRYFLWQLFAFCWDAPPPPSALPLHAFQAEEDKLASTQISIVYYVCLQGDCTGRGTKKNSSILLHKFPFSTSTVPFNILCWKGKRKVWQQSWSLRQFLVSRFILSVQEYGNVLSPSCCWNKLSTHHLKV